MLLGLWACGNEDGDLPVVQQTAQTLTSPPVIDGYVRDPVTGVVEPSYVVSGITYTQDQITGQFAGLLYQAEDANYLYFGFAQSTGINDNTYKANQIGWLKKRGHLIKDLTQSEHIKVRMYDNTDTLVLDYFIDYATVNKQSGVYYCAGVTGGDGNMLLGSAAHVDQSGSSLVWDINTASPLYPNRLTTNPQRVPTNTYDPGTTADPSYPWIYELVYEWRVAKAAFGSSGYKRLEILEVHNSPLKSANNPVPIPVLNAKKTSIPVSGSNVQPGDVITYTVSFNNPSTVPFTNLVITDKMDVNLSNITPQDSGTYDPATRVITWNVGTLAAGGSGSVSFSATVTPASKNPFPTQILNWATLNATELPGPFDTNTVIHYPQKLPIAATAKLTPSCSLEFNYSVTAVTGIDGKPVTNPDCSWSFSDGGTSTNCSGTHQVSASGSFTGTVVVTDPATGDSKTFTTAPVSVYDSLSVTASLTASCNNKVNYSATTSGGGTGLTYAWTFSPADANPNTSTSASGTFLGTANQTYTGEVTVTYLRSDGLTCTASDTDTAVAPTGITATVVMTPTCGLTFNYSTSNVVGSDGQPIASPSCSWSFSDGSSSTSCSGSATASAPGSITGTLTITDPVSTCTQVFTPAAVGAYESLTVTAAMSAGCDGAMSYNATTSGGSGAGVSSAWSFAPADANPNSSNTASGTFTGTPLSTYTGTVVITDLRTDGLTCTATASASDTARATIAATAALSPSCDLSFGFDVTDVTGGNGQALANPTCAWSFSDGGSSSSCSGTRTVTAAGSFTGTVTVTDPASGCSRTFTTAAVNVYTPLSASATMAGACDGAITYNGSATGGSPAGVSYSWAFTPGSASPASSSSATGTISGTALTSYTGTLTITDKRTDKTCTTTATANATAQASIGATAALSPSCDLSFGYSATGATGADGAAITNPGCSWIFSNGSTSTSCDGTMSTTAAGQVTGTLTVTDPASGCAKTFTTAAVNVHAPLSVSAAAVAKACEPKFDYSATVTGGSNAGGVSYSWTFAPGTASPTSSTAASGTVTGGELATYTATLVVTDPRTDKVCTATDATTVTLAAVPTATAELTASCEQGFGYKVTSATGANGLPISSPGCSWSFSDGSSSSTCDGTASMAAAGSYTGTVTITDPGSSCTVSVTTGSVTAYEALAVTATLSEGCDGAMTYNAAATGGSPAGVGYAWGFTPTDATPNSSTTASGTISGTPQTTYTGTVTITDLRTDGLTCTATSSDSATARATISATAALSPSCDLSFGYAVTNVLGANGQALANPTCSWSFSDGGSSSSCSGTRSTSAAGSFTGTVTVTDPATGCSRTFTTAAVNVYTPLAAGATLSSGCDGAVTYAGTASGGSPAGVTYSWVFAPGSANPSSSSAASGTFTGTALATYTGTLTITDKRTDKSCTATASDTAVARAGVAATAALSPSCDLSFGYSASGMTGGNGGPISNPSCAWSFSNGSSSSSCSGSMTTTSAGQVSGTLTVTDPATGCSKAFTTAAVNVYTPLATTVALAGKTCEPKFDYSASVSGGSNASGVSYSWTFSPASASPAASSSASGTVAGSALTTYTATLTITDPRTDKVCTATDSATVTLAAVPTATAELTPTCDLSFGYKVTSATGANGQPITNPGCAWTFSKDGTSSSSCNGTMTATQGSHTGALTITDPASSCTVTLTTAAVAVYPPLSVTADLTPTCTESVSYNATVTGGSGGVSYAWTFSPASANPATSSSQSGSVAGVANVLYTGNLTITDQRTDVTCTASASDSATPRKGIQVSLAPTAVAPSCPTMTNDSVTYQATVTGGSGNFSYSWSGATLCSGTSCTIDPIATTYCDSVSISLTVTDSEGLCGAGVSETETYTKITTITASNN